MASAFNSADRIISSAMADAGLLQKGEVPDSTDYADAMNRLNDLVNFYQTQGLKLWLNEMVTVTLQEGVATYSLGPAGTLLPIKPMRVLEAYYNYPPGGAASYPLTMASWNDYNLLSNKSQAGSINTCFVDKQQLNVNVTFWLVPDAVSAQGTVQLLTQTAPQQLVNITDAMVFPQEWFLALRWGLADDLATGQPDSIVARCLAKAQQYRQALEDWDVEDAPTRFTPSPYATNMRGMFS